MKLNSDVWMRLTPVIRTRQKLKDWGRKDLLALALKLYGTTALDKTEVAALLVAIKRDPNKPEPTWYEHVPAEGLVAPGELTIVDNGSYQERPQSLFEVGGNVLVLRTANARETTAWALTMLDQDPRRTWADLRALWKRWTRLSGFSLPECFAGYGFTKEAAAALARARRKDAAAKTPLPDNGDLKKRYWALEPGDVLPHKEDAHVLRVASVRLNMGSAPTITFEKEELSA